MDTNKEREDFEKYIQTVAHPHRSPEVMFFTVNDGYGNVIYCDISIQNQWETWQARAQSVPGWISVEDRLPELKEHTWRTALPVNVMIDGYGQYLCYPCQYSNGVFYWADATYYGNEKGEHPIKCDRDTEVLNVTHWMPLPDAPQEPAND